MRLISIFLLLSALFAFSSVTAQTVPFIGDDKGLTQAKLESYCENLNYQDSIGRLTVKNDTLIYSYDSELVGEHTYIFSNGVCVSYSFRFDDMYCGKEFLRKRLFKGVWRENKVGELLNKRRNLIASIEQVNDSPFSYEVKFHKSSRNIRKDAFEEMEKLDKSLIGTGAYIIEDNQ